MLLCKHDTEDKYMAHAKMNMLTAQVPVFCNGLHGVYLLGRQRIVCSCPDCMAKPEAKRDHSCTQFEMHCGAGAAKKWKASLRVEPGGVPEVPKGALLLLSHTCATYPPQTRA